MVSILLERALRAAGVPMVGLSMGTEADKSTWVVRFAPEATAAHRQTAASVIAAFVVPDAATLLVEEADSRANDKIIRAVAMALWECIPAPTMTRPQLADRIRQIYRNL